MTVDAATRLRELWPGPARPPGPRALLLRSIVQGRRNPLVFFGELAERFGDVVFFRIGRTPVYAIYHPEDVGQVLLGDHRAFVKDEITRELSFVLGEGLLTSEGETWKRQRKLASPSLSKRHIEAYAEIMVSRARAAVPAWAGSGGIRDVHADMMRLTLQIVVDTLFGGESAGGLDRVSALVGLTMTEFERHMGGWRRLFPQWVPSRAMFRVRRARAELDEILMGIVRTRRASGREGDDLLWRLLSARDENGAAMDDRQLRDESLTLFIAGHETTALLLSYALHMVSIHASVAEAVRHELDEVLGDRPPRLADLPRLRWTEAVVKETLRLFPPAWSIGRETTREVALGNWTAPSGAQIVIPLWVIHRDPRWWTDPGRFRPERWLDGTAEAVPRFAYLPFGGGPRVCIGNHFAAMEAILVLACVLSRVNVFPVAGFRLELAPSVTLRPRTGVRLRVAAREDRRE
jgi:cytochrome P450